MRTHTNDFKNNIKNLGRQFNVRVVYGGTTLQNEQINNATLNYNGDILKSVMKMLKLDSNIDIPLNTQITFEFGLLVGNSYEYINYGSFIVNKSEKQENTNSYLLTCYDKMLYSMKPYEDLGVTYPITIRNYINALCTKLGLQFQNASDNFVNYNKEIPNELYLDEQGNSLDYNFRDVLDELAQVTASTICINDSGKLEIRYITNTNDTIDEEFLKNVNVNFGEQYGAINTITFSRSADSDSISKSIPENLPDADKIEIKISDNQILNGNNRDEFIDGILNKLYGLSYHVNDFSSTGITYYDLCDRYNITVGENTYSCVMLNDEININNGLVENIFTNMPKTSKTDYSKVDKTDRKANQTTLIVNKQEGRIDAVVSQVEDIVEDIQNPTSTKQGTSIDIQDALDSPLIDFTMYGDTQQDGEPTPSTPIPIQVVTGRNEIKWTGKNLFDKNGILNNGYINENGGVSSSSNFKYTDYIPIQPNTTYTTSGMPSGTGSEPSRAYYDKNKTFISAFRHRSQTKLADTSPSNAYYMIESVRVADLDTIQIELGNLITTYEEFKGFTQEINLGKNLFDKSNITRLNGTISSTSEMYFRGGGANYAVVIPCQPNTTYTVQKRNDGNTNRFALASSETIPSSTTDVDTTILNKIREDGAFSLTLTTGATAKYLIVQYYRSAESVLTEQQILDSIQIEKGNKATSYSEYFTPIELCKSKDGTLEDYIYGESDRWYLHKEIRKIVLDGINFTPYDRRGTSTNTVAFNISLVPNILNYGSNYIICNRFGYEQTSTSGNEGIGVPNNSTSLCYIQINKSRLNGIEVNDFNTWLQNNNVEVYYVLAEATETEITYQPLIDQLNALISNPLFKGLNHITNETFNLYPNLKIEYFRDTSINENFVSKEDMTKYYTKVETDAQIQINSSSIRQSVSELQNTVDSEGNAITSLSNQVSTLQTSTSLQINAISQTLENGVEKLANSLVTIDTNGIKTSRTNETFNTQITNKTFEVKDRDKPLAFIGYKESEQRTVAQIDDLESARATIGVHRCETITRNGKKRTAWFYTGGGN